MTAITNCDTEALARLAAVVEFSSDAILTKDLQCRVTSWNRGAEKLYGYCADEILGREVSVLVPPQRVGEEREILDRVLAGELVGSFETQRVAADGTVIDVSLSVAAIPDASGEIVGVSSIARDAREAKRAATSLCASNELLYAVVSSLTEGILVSDGTGAITTCNVAAERMLGLTAAQLADRAPDEPPWKAIREDGTPVDADQLPIAVTLRTGEPQRGVVQGVQRPDGSLAWIAINSQPLFAPGEQDGYGVVASLTDVTDRRRADHRILELNEGLERRVHQRTTELQAANAELTDFAHALAHDLRTPLRAIAGFARALQQRRLDPTDGEAEYKLQRIVLAATRMGELIDAVLLLSQITRRELEVSRVNLSAIAREIAEQLRSEDQGRRVEFVIEDGLEADADPDLIRILLRQLLENAWKFTEPRERARIELRRTSDHAFVVRDNGIGFDMAHAGSLFRPFSRLHRVDEVAGNGVGLTLVDRIIRRHGGSVSGVGRPNRGAAFHFTLERKEEYAR